jgi:hypothetical protein
MSGGNRVLIVLDAAFDEPEIDLPSWAREAVVGATSVHLLAPYIGTRVSVATDDDEPRRRALYRLERVMGYLRSIGTRPSGSVSDDSPIDAVATYLIENQADRIVVVLTAEGSWREKSLMQRISALTPASVEGIAVSSHRHSEAVHLP